MVPDMCGMQDRQWRTSCYDPGLWIYASCRRTSSSKDGNSANQRLFERQICTVFASVTQAAFEGLILRYPMNIDHSSFSFKFSGTFQHFWATSCHHFVREFNNFIYRCLRFIYFPSLHEGASASSSTLLVCPVLARREKWESGFPGFPCLTLLRSWSIPEPFHLPSPMLRHVVLKATLLSELCLSLWGSTIHVRLTASNLGMKNRETWLSVSFKIFCQTWISKMQWICISYACIMPWHRHVREGKALCHDKDSARSRALSLGKMSKKHSTALHLYCILYRTP